MKKHSVPSPFHSLLLFMTFDCLMALFVLFQGCWGGTKQSSKRVERKVIKVNEWFKMK